MSADSLNDSPYFATVVELARATFGVDITESDAPKELCAWATLCLTRIHAELQGEIDFCAECDRAIAMVAALYKRRVN